MFRNTKFNFFILFLIIVCGVNAQNYTINGKVFDAETKEPLPFVPVMLKGTTLGSTTDFDGNWSPKRDDNVCLQIGNINTEAILIELDENEFKFKLSKPVCIPNNSLIIVCSSNNEIKIVGFGKLNSSKCNQII